MTDTANLALPLMEAAQAQKHVTHNEALAQLDACVQVSVIARGLAAPPAAPARGARYIVAAGGTGAFAGHVDEIAYRDEAGWRFVKPQTGWIIWSQADGAPFVFVDGGWARLDWRMLAPANLRLAGPGAVVNVSAARTLSAIDDGRVLAVNAVSALVLTVPANLPVGFACVVVQVGVGQVTFVGGVGATLGQVANAFRTSGRHARADLACVGAGAFVLSGSLVA
jgi:hypothetical protein